MRLTLLAALALLITPASAQTEQVCLSKTIGGKDISPPMCFAPESLTGGIEGQCEVVLIPSGGTRCVHDRPEPPKPAPAPLF
jgi:hypothetical protein